MLTFASRLCRQSSVSRLVVLVRPPLCCSVLQCGVAMYCIVSHNSVCHNFGEPTVSFIVSVIADDFGAPPSPVHCVAVCSYTGLQCFCSVPQRVAVCCNARCRLSTFASRPCRPLLCHCRWFWCVPLSVAVCYSVVLQCVAVCCNARCRLSTFASRPCRPLSCHCRWFWCVPLSVAVFNNVVLQCVAVCCNAQQHLSTSVSRPCCSFLASQPVVVALSVAVCCSVFVQGVAECCIVVLQRVAACCSVLQCTVASVDCGEPTVLLIVSVTAGDFGASPFLLQYVAVWCCRGLQVVAVWCCSVV